jgi:ring-1,2-phenylacetyl-CoA epoxidase subunit PaaD
VNATLTEADVRAALATVHDPEIPTCSITDLGIVQRVDVGADGVAIDLLPTYSGCPALDVIREDVERAVQALGAHPTVRFVMSPPWTSDRLTDAGRAALAEYGIAGPVLQIGSKPVAVPCPYCGSGATELQSSFGPTLCRTIRYCNACRNPFEGFKTKG